LQALTRLTGALKEAAGASPPGKTVTVSAANVGFGAIENVTGLLYFNNSKP